MANAATYPKAYNNLLKTVYGPRSRLLVFRDLNNRERAPRPGSKEYNQLLKAARRAATGKPSYRKRQASARAARHKQLTRV